MNLANMMIIIQINNLYDIGDKLSEDEVEMLINEADQDGDGTLDYEEFVKMMTSKD